jgi:hypothetical protein
MGILQQEFAQAGVAGTETTETPEQNAETEEQQETQESQTEEPENPEVAQSPDGKKAQPSKDVEEILVSDAEGRKKIKVDFSDKEKLKRYVAKAYGADKFREERDKYKTQLDKIDPEYKELKQGWTELNGAYEQGGMRGLVNLLLDDNQGYDKFIQAEIAKAEKLKNASPEELRNLQLEERFESERKEREKLAKKIAERDAQELTSRQESQESHLKALIEPAFNKYRFSGKLGDAEVEQAYDEAVWTRAIKQLRPVPDDVELSSAQVEDIFRKQAALYQKAVSKQVETKTKQVMGRKKLDAQERATATVSKANRTGVRETDLEADLHGGNFGGAFKNFFGIK